MREIKFRGKDKFGKWVYGNYIDWGNHEQVFIFPLLDYATSLSIGESVCAKAKRVDVNTVGQYTGLKDKNDVEIYEGDIVKVWADIDGYLPAKKYVTAFIRFDDVECHFGWVVDYRYAAKVGYDESIQNVRYDIEVIGNIYDNPELLEVEE